MMADIIGEVITLTIMAFALAMDAFSVGLGMGMFRLRLRQIFKIGITIGLFHVWMPLLGIFVGRFISEQFGAIASYIGGGLLLILGVQMVFSGLKKDKETLIAPFGWGLVFFGFSVSLDSFSVSLTLGIYGAKTVLVLMCFGITATVLTWIGLLVGRKVQSWLGSYSEAFGGSILLAFGIKLLLG